MTGNKYLDVGEHE